MFGDDYPSVGSECGKGGTECEAHAQSAYQYPRSLAGTNSLARNYCKRPLGSTDAAIHQFVVTEHNREFGATPHKAKLAASVGHLRRIEQSLRNHGTLFSIVNCQPSRVLCLEGRLPAFAEVGVFCP